MTTQTMIEKMVRAHDAEDAAQRGEPSPWEQCWCGNVDNCPDCCAFRSDRIAAMRAALQALREPTFEMWRAGASVTEVGTCCLPAAFTAMIDAILQEKAENQ